MGSAAVSGSRAAVLSQAGAPLSWTSERAGTLFASERARKAAPYKRQPQRAERAMCTERGDTFFVPERRRSRRLPSAIRARDVRAADLQEEMAEQRFSVPSAPTKTAATRRTSQRAERAIDSASASERSGPLDGASASERSNQTRLQCSRVQPTS